jgi:hypothetical protein
MGMGRPGGGPQTAAGTVVSLHGVWFFSCGWRCVSSEAWYVFEGEELFASGNWCKGTVADGDFGSPSMNTENRWPV